ncbi:MAG: hypothetical protein LUD16_04525, partial [Lachnospiraceae bacterium]|nr:hypothetical protein [Lachnospiraceae bacterium]
AECGDNRVKQNEEEHTNNEYVQNVTTEDLIHFLNLIYKKTETSLALINGNKNRCKTELRSTLNLIKEYAKKVENSTE